MKFENGEINEELEQKEDFSNLEEETPIQDLDDVEELMKLIEETPPAQIEMSWKGREKQYIDTREHKHVDETTENEESWLDSESDEEPKEKNKLNIKIPKLSSYQVFVGVIGICIIAVMLMSRPTMNTQINSSSNNNDIVITTNPVQNTYKPTEQELKQLSTMALSYTQILKQIEEIRSYEIKVLNGFVTGEYSEKQVKSLISQTASTKDTTLADIENDKVLAVLNDLKVLMERYVRAELNSTKKALASINNGLDAVSIYNTFSNETTTMANHATNFSDELEKLLKIFNIKYTRDGNYFEF